MPESNHPDNGTEGTDEDLVGAIYDALDNGRPTLALQLASRALGEGPDDDPVLHFLTGVAHLELDQPARALESLDRANQIDPDDPEFRCQRSLALFRLGDYETAAQEAERAMAIDPSSPDARYLLGLLDERNGRFEEADIRFGEATDRDPERFPLPMRTSSEEFSDRVRQAMDRLPETFRRHLDAVSVTVEEIPSQAILEDGSPHLDAEHLLGLFVGVPLGESAEGTHLPPRILIFKRNLERMATDLEELENEIAVTVYHELGHYLGLDEDDLERIDLA